MGDYDSIDRVDVEGSGLRAQIGPVTATASLDLSASAVSQMTLRVLDPGLTLLRSRVLARKAAVNIEGLRLQVAAESVESADEPAPVLVAECRPRSVAALRARSGARTWSNVSPDGLVRVEAESVGLKVLAEARPRRRQIVRKVEANQPPETSWDLLLRLAKEEGAWVWEAEGTLYFGRPTWLLTRLPVYRVDWWAPGSGQESTPSLLKAPDVRWSDDDKDTAASGSMTLLRDQAQVLTPGVGVQLGGSLGPFCRRYIVTALKLDVGGRTGEVSFETPVNPTPEPPTEDAEPTPAARPAPRPAAPKTTPTPTAVRRDQPITSTVRARNRRASEGRYGPYNPDRHRRFQDGSFRPRRPGEKRDDVVRAEDGSWVSRSFYRRS